MQYIYGTVFLTKLVQSHHVLGVKIRILNILFFFAWKFLITTNNKITGQTANVQ